MSKREIWKNGRVDFSINPLRFSAIGHLYSIKEEFDLEPAYQRESSVWGIDKKQLLIDSLINKFDVPKLYVHDLLASGMKKKEGVNYAVVDGKQRLHAIWAFMDGVFPLANDFKLLDDPQLDLSGLKYQDIVDKYPKLGTFFTSISLPVEVITCEKIEFIEELFSRLNDAVPLNAPEKRNALGGPVPKALKRLRDQTSFFKSKLPFRDTRYKYLDLACKLLFIESVGEIVNLHKKNLDNYVERIRDTSDEKNLKIHEKEVTKTLAAMDRVFTVDDVLLKNVGAIIPIYWLFKKLLETKTVSKITRKSFLSFEAERANNRKKAEADEKANYLFLKYDEYAQSLNDASAIEFKYALLARNAAPWLEKVDKRIKEILKKEEAIE